MTQRRIVITGLGAISPLGIGTETLWQGLSQGTCGIDTIKAFDPVGFTCKLAGQVPEFKIQKHLPKFHRKAAKLMCRDIQLAVIAANEAFQSSGLITRAIDPDNVNIDPARTAINIGAGVICCDIVELSPAVAQSITNGKFDINKWGQQGLDALTPLWLLKYLPNMPACHIAIIHDIQGPNNSITSAEAAAHLAVGEAADVIARGDADVALAGGCDAKVNPIMMLRQCLLKRTTSENNDDPESALRPFDADAKGSVFGEGSGMVILEEFERAKQRNAKIYAELVGVGSSNNINPAYEHLEPDGKAIRFAIENALDNAAIRPDQLDLIIPHGLGIPADDRAEAEAIKNALGNAVDKIAVWPTKSMLSATGAAGGALDLIAAAKAIDQSRIGPAKNYKNKARGCDLNISPQAQKKNIRYALCSSYTFGGQTAALILKNTDGKN
jgi:3-oxoacyl-[acyl-carrier-protein] synthase II